MEKPSEEIKILMDFRRALIHLKSILDDSANGSSGQIESLKIFNRAIKDLHKDIFILDRLAVYFRFIAENRNDELAKSSNLCAGHLMIIRHVVGDLFEKRFLLSAFIYDEETRYIKTGKLSEEFSKQINFLMIIVTRFTMYINYIKHALDELNLDPVPSDIGAEIISGMIVYKN